MSARHLEPGDLVTAPAMTPFLLAMRAGIIMWVTLAVMPFEIVHDAIEGELTRRGVEL
jgi:hypothetical protein